MDRITLEVIGSALLSTAEEMGEALIKASYSSNIKERQDCSTALFTLPGDVIAQAEHIPMHLGSLIMIVQEILKRYPVGALREGDVFIGNDPAQRAYEKCGFEVVIEKRDAAFEAAYGSPGARILRRGL